MARVRAMPWHFRSQRKRLTLSTQHEDIYTPQFGSIPHKVLQFLSDNPDEELTRSDVATKFDTSPAGVDSLLKLAKARGSVTVSRNSDAQLVWRLGDVQSFRLVDSQANQLEDNNAVDQASAPVVAGMPFDSEIKPGDEFSFLPEYEARRKRAVKSYWTWFSRFNEKDVAEFDAKHIRDVACLAGKYGKEAGKKFKCRQLGNGRAVICRLS